MDSNDTARLADLPARISACVQEGQMREAKALMAEILLYPEALRQWLTSVEHEFRKGGRLEPLIEVLWANRDTALNDMFVVGHFMRFCSRASLYDRFGPLLRSWIASDSTADFTFTEYGHFRHFRRLTDEQKRDFADAKYRRWKDSGTQDFFRTVDRFSVFANVSRPIVEFLFERRQNKNVFFSPWMQDLRSSELLKHILADMKTLLSLNKKNGSPAHAQSRYPRLPELADLVDLERAKSFFAQLDLSKGLL